MDNAHFVIHIPHSSVNIPEAYRKGILLTDEELFRELAQKTDAFCHELFCDDEHFPVRVISPVSRLVCDVERFRDDAQEPNAKKGEGLMYTRTLSGKVLREYDLSVRERVLAEFYDPHHQRLTQAVDNALASTNRCTILDGHSFNSKRPVRLACLLDRPDFCIGTDAFHTPASLRDAMIHTVRKAGYHVRVNTPFGGSITPMKHYGQDKRVASVMVEVNRKLYMNETAMEKSAGFEKTRMVCLELMRTAAAWGE